MTNIRLIDLGLPSGTLWGDRNVGAETPESEGIFVTWGGTEPHDASDGYFQENYEHWKEFKESKEEEYTAFPKQYEERIVFDPSTFDPSTFDPSTAKKEYREMGKMSEEDWFEMPTGCHYDASTRYIVDPQDPSTYEPWQETRIVIVSHWDWGKYNNTDGKQVLDNEDDAAYVGISEDFCMPTKEQWEELFENTTMEVIPSNGSGVAKFTSPNGRSVVFPLCGCRHEYYNCGDVYGEYWCKDRLTEKDAYRTLFADGMAGRVQRQWRIIGMQIRAVKK